MNVFLNVAVCGTKYIFLLERRNFMFERTDLVPSQVNGTVFTEYNGIETVIPFPKSQFQKTDTKNLL